MSALLEVRGLEAGYHGSRVLHGVDLDVEEGKILTMLGRNGVGKTTLVMAMMGLVHVTAGSVRLDGRELVGARSDVIARAGIGLIPQGRRIFGPLTVEENLRIAVRRGVESDWTIERVYEFLPRLAQRKRNRGDQLSGGEQQMLAIGRALLTNPRVLLIDEPSEGLAPIIVRQVADVVRSLKDKGASVLLVEQDLSAALRVADDVAVMEKGEIVLRSTAEQFQRDPHQIGELLGVS
jgi:branched-chain amino acid transport system ATP-binding protein